MYWYKVWIRWVWYWWRINYSRAEDLILNKKCETLEEAYHYLAEAQKRLTEEIRNKNTSKSNKWLLLEDISDEDVFNLQELLKDLDVEKITDNNINKLVSTSSKFLPYFNCFRWANVVELILKYISILNFVELIKEHILFFNIKLEHKKNSNKVLTFWK